jgi:hypothetical protein
MPSQHEPIPYEAPAAALTPQEIQFPSTIDRKLAKKFREQIHALGALWIIIGSVVVASAAFAVAGNRSAAGVVGSDVLILLMIFGAIGLTWFTLGVLTCLKQMPAVYVALILSYVSLLGQAISLNVCGAVILVIVIL